MEALRYASGSPTRDSDVLLYHLCKTFGCLPSQLDNENPEIMERLALIDYIVESKIQAELRNRNG